MLQDLQHMVQKEFKKPSNVTIINSFHSDLCIYVNKISGHLIHMKKRNTVDAECFFLAISNTHSQTHLINRCISNTILLLCFVIYILFVKLWYILYCFDQFGTNNALIITSLRRDFFSALRVLLFLMYYLQHEHLPQI